MKKTTSGLIISFLLIFLCIITSTSLITQGHKEISSIINNMFIQDTGYSYTDHTPITIANDVDLNTTSTSGNGTSKNTYILEGWNITTSATHGIYIHDTTKHFILRNC